MCPGAKLKEIVSGVHSPSLPAKDFPRVLSVRVLSGSTPLDVAYYAIWKGCEATFHCFSAACLQDAAVWNICKFIA